MNTTAALEAAEPIIAGITRRFKFRRADREDARQECHVAIIEALSKFDASRGSLHAFISGVVRNRLIDYKRQLEAKHRQAESLPAGDELASAGGAEYNITASILNDPAAYLTVRKAALLNLLFIADDRAELAGWLGCSIDRANERVSRLVRDLRELAAA
jgi:DNA-directed RNA polymerase specialized sigma24 family protein